MARFSSETDRKTNADSCKAQALSLLRASMARCDAGLAHSVRRETILLALGALLAAHVAGVCLDVVAAVRYPFELDYGEGIVWQQAELIPGPRMYGSSPDLPFIVFHYPPLYYLIVRAVLSVQPDFLAAGRLVSSLSMALIGLLVTGLVLIATRRSGQQTMGVELGSAVAAGLLVLCLPVVRTWGLMMRVDMVAIMLSMMGLLMAAWSNGRFWGTLGALLLCVASVFTKQTQLPAGVAVFLIALLCNPRGALAAAAVAGAVGLGALELMEELTGNGFLQNIIGYNVNRLSLQQAYRVFWSVRASFPFMILMLLAFVVLWRAVLLSAPRLRPRTALRDIGALRRADRATACQALLLLEFVLATLMLPTTLKSGSSYNYLLEWLCTGCVLIGIMLVGLARNGAPSRRRFQIVALLLMLSVAALPLRYMPNQATEADLAWQEALVARIAAARKPVASEDMTLLMRAGKPVIFEPAIVTELASTGQWDEAPLIEMIRARGFAFMITTDNAIGGTSRRTPAVDAAMRDAYPRVEQASPELWLNLPSS